MDPIQSIQYGRVRFKKSNLLHHRLLIGIDCGYVTTKVVFVHHKDKEQLLNDQIDYVTLSHGVFKNEHFADAVQLLKTTAFIPDGSTEYIHVTGQRAVVNKDVVESILGLKTKYVEDTLATVAGLRMALEQIGLDNLMAPPVEVESQGQIKNDLIEKFVVSFAAKFSSPKEDGPESSIFPCLMNVFNSDSQFYYFDKDGKVEILSLPSAGGTTFLGLGKCLLDTNTYDDILELASNGNQGNVDTLVKDVLDEDPNSPYGGFPPDMPIFPFGKGMDSDKNLEDYKKEDIAMSLVGLFSVFMIIKAISICTMKRILKIYLCGNIFRSNIFQKEIKRCLMFYPMLVQVEILDLGYNDALGAMLCDNLEREKYLKE